MNKNRRNKLKKSIIYIEMAQEIIKSVKDEEEFAYDNIPENLQNSNKACDMEDSIDSLDEIIDNINDIKTLLNDIVL